MVERNLAKVKVASSRLVSRSTSKGKPGLPFFVRMRRTARRDSKAVMQRIANPSSPVRLRIAPPRKCAVRTSFQTPGSTGRCCSWPDRSWWCAGWQHRARAWRSSSPSDNAPAARMAKSADAADLKSAAPKGACGFEPRFGHQAKEWAPPASALAVVASKPGVPGNASQRSGAQVEIVGSGSSRCAQCAAESSHRSSARSICATSPVHNTCSCTGSV